MRGAACLELGRANECLMGIEQAVSLGAPVEEYGLLRVRCHLELGQAQVAFDRFRKHKKQ